MCARPASRIARIAWSLRCAATWRRPCRSSGSRRRLPRQPWTGLGSRARVRQLGNDVAGAGFAHLHVAGNLPPQLDLDLAVADHSGHPAAGADQQALADDKVTLERAAHVRVLDFRTALEQPAFG